MKVLRTYGRRYKQRSGKTDSKQWSPEVVVICSPKKTRAEQLFDALTTTFDGPTSLVPSSFGLLFQSPPALPGHARTLDGCSGGPEGAENLPQRTQKAGGRTGLRKRGAKCGTRWNLESPVRQRDDPEWDTETDPRRRRKGHRRDPLAASGTRRGPAFGQSGTGEGPFCSTPKNSFGSGSRLPENVARNGTESASCRSETKTYGAARGLKNPEASSPEKMRLRLGTVRRRGGERTLVSGATSAVAAVLDFSFSSSLAGGSPEVGLGNSSRPRPGVSSFRVPPDPDPGAVLLRFCGQEEAVGFDRALGERSAEGYCKIGEGVYGEVYRHVERVFKVVPVQGDALVNGERQKTLLEILPEVVISLELSSLTSAVDNRCANFVRTERVQLVRGCYPPALLRAWDAFHKGRGSHNDRPDFFDEGQLFVVLEMADGGCGLETWQVKDAKEARSIFLQVACTLAVAEAALEYEHRDLHLGNLLVRSTSQDSAGYLLHGEPLSVPTAGVHVSVVDHTLSRIRKGGTVLFTDLSRDPTLFEGKGDHQFEVYRRMRRHNGNDWEAYRPYSNVLWLRYLLGKLRSRNRLAASPSDRADRNQLDTWFREILQCSSASDFVLHQYRDALPVPSRRLRSGRILTRAIRA